jgi:hypothetical protein
MSLTQLPSYTAFATYTIRENRNWNSTVHFLHALHHAAWQNIPTLSETRDTLLIKQIRRSQRAANGEDKTRQRMGGRSTFLLVPEQIHLRVNALTHSQKSNIRLSTTFSFGICFSIQKHCVYTGKQAAVETSKSSCMQTWSFLGFCPKQAQKVNSKENRNTIISLTHYVSYTALHTHTIYENHKRNSTIHFLHWKLFHKDHHQPCTHNLIYF